MRFSDLLVLLVFLETCICSAWLLRRIKHDCKRRGGPPLRVLLCAFVFLYAMVAVIGSSALLLFQGRNDASSKNEQPVAASQ